MQTGHNEYICIAVNIIYTVAFQFPATGDRLDMQLDGFFSPAENEDSVL